jgi:glycosyltransferase involved in cell wall biosynthesis
MLRRIAGKVSRAGGRLLHGPLESAGGTVTLPACGGRARGKALFSYLTLSFHWPDDDPRFDGHTNAWESREIARVFQELGFEVHGIRYDDREFEPREKYDVLFDIHGNLQRLAPRAGANAVKLLHCTGSAASYQNAAHLARIEALRRRRGVDYPPERFLADAEEQLRSLEIADACSLLGNDHTRSTYPEHLRRKFTLIPVTGSRLGENVKREHEFAPPEREFLWFFGGGAAHKGLDLALEAFARNPDWVLNIVGGAKDEPDFFRVYARELTQLPNIRCHGWLLPNSPEFGRVVRRSFCFLAPSCSEGMSPAVVTCMQAGLYPIVSRDTGVDLPAGCGMMLEPCGIREIEDAVRAAFQLPNSELTRQIAQSQAHALIEYSRQRFHETMAAFVRKALALSRAGNVTGRAQI